MLSEVWVCWQILPDADGKKPQAKHLQTRAEYLLKVLRKQAEFSAAPVSSLSCWMFLPLSENLIFPCLMYLDMQCSEKL